MPFNELSVEDVIAEDAEESPDINSKKRFRHAFGPIQRAVKDRQSLSEENRRNYGLGTSLRFVLLKNFFGRMDMPSTPLKGNPFVKRV
jgi:hypothetical protein